MDEQKVRKAVEVANELVKWQNYPEGCFVPIWRDVFGALVAEPYSYPTNYTTTGAELAEKQMETK